MVYLYDPCDPCCSSPPCTACDPYPSRWELTASGFTNDAEGDNNPCTLCDAYNGTHVLEFSQLSEQAGPVSCQWLYLTEQTSLCSIPPGDGYLWGIAINQLSDGSVTVTALTDVFSQAFGGFAQYREIPISNINSFVCNEEKTLAFLSGDETQFPCATYPSEITITPVI